MKIFSKQILTVFLLVVFPSIPVFAVPLTVGPYRDVEIAKGGKGETSITISGHTPHFWSGVVASGYDPKRDTVLSFQYFAPNGLDDFSVRTKQEDGSVRLAGSAELPLAQAWQPFSILLTDPGKPAEEMRFHFSLDGNIGDALRIRNVEVRPPDASEVAALEERDSLLSAREADAEKYLQYLRDWYPNAVTGIRIGETTVTVEGFAADPLNLTELRPHDPSHVAKMGRKAATDLLGRFELTFSRLASDSGHDRALSRWRLDSPNGQPASLARWPDQVEDGIARDLTKAEAETRKGLGGIPDIRAEDHEIFELGIGHATVNLVVDALLHDKAKPGLKPFDFEGSRYFYNSTFLENKVNTVERLTENGVVVSFILLVGNRSESRMTHPEAERRGIYSIPNLATEDGAKFYRAAIHFLAERFSRPEARVSNWIVHNEIDQAGTWTNMGDQPLARYLETYMRSARIVHHTTRLFDPHARVFVSLTHHWAKPASVSGVYMVRDIVELFSEMARAEGDFEWGLAYHPYPENLRDPDTWADEKPTMGFDTPYITPKNLHVLPAYLKQERFLFEGKERAILFSEQGFNTPTLSEADQKRQVAATHYTFRKLDDLPTVEAFHMHRYRDIPEREGGLQMGLLDKEGNRKLIWEAYATLGTEAGKEFEKIADDLLPSSKDTTEIEKPRTPNIVLILADDLGWSDTTPYQDPSEDFYETPAVAALAERGMRFTRAYSASPLCSPTRASILNGQYPGRIRLTTPACHIPQVILEPGLKSKAPPTSPVIEPETRTRFPNFYVTIPEVLKHRGYQSAFVGKWHLGRAPYFPEQQGFDLVIGGREHPGPPGGFFAPWPIDTIPESPPGAHIDDVITTESIEWMKGQAEKGKPFFLNLWYYSVHAPFQAKPDLIEKYKRKAESLPDNAPRTNPVMAAMIETMDTNIGRITAALEELGVAENTLVIFTSDNGGNEYNFTAGELATNNHPLANGKGNIKEGGQRVPFIAAWPGRISGGSVNEGLVSSIDLFPTLLEAAGAKATPGQHVDGISLMPTLLGESEIDADRSIFCHFPHSPPATGTRAGTSVQRGRYKLTRYHADGQGQQDRLVLVDTLEDPQESNNLAGAKPKLVSELAQEIENHLSETNSLVPRPNPEYEPSTLGWKFTNVDEAARNSQGLTIVASNSDPQMRTGDFPKAKGNLSIRIAMDSDNDSEALAFWATSDSPGISGDRKVAFERIPEGWQADFDLGKESLKQIRIDPSNRKGTTRIRSIRLIEWKEPGEGKTVRLWEF